MLKLVPLIVTLPPEIPLRGAKLLIPGSILKSATLCADPARFPTLTFPVVQAAGTTTLINVVETTVIGLVIDVPLNFTFDAEPTFVPEMVTVAPIGAPPTNGLVVKVIFAGGLITVNVPELITVPLVVVTLILLVIAVAGTVTII